LIFQDRQQHLRERAQALLSIEVDRPPEAARFRAFFLLPMSATALTALS